MEIIAYFFSKKTFEIIDVLQVKDYQINLDEETNAKTSIMFARKPRVNDKDIIFLKDHERNFMGVIEAPASDSEEIYKIECKYITNLFDREIILKNANLIKENGIEDFIAYTIENEFLNSDDELLNMKYIEIEVLTHTKKQFAVSTENGIYNFHTFITNCTQNYNIVYDFTIKKGKIHITIENIEDQEKIIVDTNVSDIVNYVEVKNADVIAKITVLCADKSEHKYFLLNDRTTSDDIDNENRATGNIKTIYEEESENARQAALNLFKSNSYSHLIQFDINKNSKLYDVQNWKIGTLVEIKNKDGEIIDTYISAISIKKDNPMFSVKTGNIRINFLDKLKQERKGGN